MRPDIKKWVIIFSILLPVSTFAQNNSWENDFVLALQEGKTESIQKTGGLGYTMSENSILKNAIKNAMEQQAPACEAMKIAVDLKYNPYHVIKNIFIHGGDINLNQICLCATEDGISKQIIARSAADAAGETGSPVFERNEIAQAQCLNEIGLGYAMNTVPFPPPLRPFSDPNPTSPITPGLGDSDPLFIDAEPL